ncbi:hypothetical protein [Luteimonas qiangzhengi]|uniref:hypothetical protein n=1 Tax=Luteimonas sp. MJ146 TaxID=3129240 RepID=UPI0031B9D85E
MSRSKSKKGKPELPSLERRYDYRSKRRDTPEGSALEALDGDKQMIARLGLFGALIMRDASENGGNLERYAWWLAAILDDIAIGKSPNEAFGWEGRAGRYKLHNGEAWSTLKKAYEVASLVDRFTAGTTGKHFDEVIDHAAALWGVPPADCRSAVTSCAPSSSPLSKTKAEGIALDMVAAYGASGHQGIARDTADGYYRDLISSRGND